MKSQIKRCTNCIFPESIPGISFDKNGICNYCNNYKPIKYLGEEKLEKFIRNAKSENKEYDCIVPLSGGRDSSYILYLAQKKYGLKTLAVNYDNEFRVSQSALNMKNACQVLNVDFISFRSRRAIAKKIVLSSMKYHLKYGLSEVLGFCSACQFGYTAVVYKMAERYNVPLILWGNSQIERTVHLTKKVLGMPLHKKMIRKYNITDVNNIKLLVYLYLQRLEFQVPGNVLQNLLLEGPKLKNKNIKEIRIFDYIPWDRKKIIETITSELGWRKPNNSKTTWRVDCKLGELVTYCFQNIFGCSKYCFGFHNMINEHQITREEALNIEEGNTAILTKNLEEFLYNDIGLAKMDIERLRSYQKPSFFLRRELDG